MSFKAQQTKISNICKDDIVIALVGPTGTGKSTFVNAATGCANAAAVDNGLKVCTSKITAFRIPRHQTGHPIVLIDTPGYDDDKTADVDLINMLGDWLSKTKGVQLAGMIYFSRISDNRSASTPRPSLHMFTRLCGENAPQKVVLLSAMWDRTKLKAAEVRERNIRERYWKQMLDLGSSTARFDGSTKSAWGVLDMVLSRNLVQQVR